VRTLFALLSAVTALQAFAQTRPLEPMDVFQLELATDPRLSPDGERIVYVRRHMDVMKDTPGGTLWLIDDQGNRPLTSGNRNDRAPRWMPDGKRILFTAEVDGTSQLHYYWSDTHQITVLTRLTRSPGGVSISPDGKQIALTMRVPAEQKPMTKLPSPPEGAEWAGPAKVVDSLVYRIDGQGYVPEGYNHIFLMPAEGGTPRQLTKGDYNHGGTPVWSPDGRYLYFSANLDKDYRYQPVDSEIYRLEVASGEIIALTENDGPAGQPAVSPDGNQIAFVGFDDRKQSYQVSTLYVMGADGDNIRALTGDLDRDPAAPAWTGDGKYITFSYTDHGVGKIARTDLRGQIEVMAENLGQSVGRPYGGGEMDVHPSGAFVYTVSTPHAPSDLAIGEPGREPRMVTAVNEDLLQIVEPAEVEEIRFPSSHDGWEVQGWIAKPPGFHPEGKYPLLLEIHGGPHADYGPRFSAEVQLFAAAGYVVLYINPRGSTSYGQEFGNYIHHNYPSEDYDDLMSGVDAVIEKGYIDTDRLYVTGGSGGGVLTAWIVGKTDRFRAAVVAKPVINWASFVLTSDFSDYFTHYWFPGPPWEHAEHYMKRSPLSLVGNVTTPTMLLCGEEDWRTPISESEQYHKALALRKVETAMVRIPGAGHGIAARPSHLIAKVAHILAWFDRYSGQAVNRKEVTTR